MIEKKVLWCRLGFTPAILVYYFYYDLGLRTLNEMIKEFEQMEKEFNGASTCLTKQEFIQTFMWMIELGYIIPKDIEIEALIMQLHDKQIIDEVRAELRKYYKVGLHGRQ